MSDIWGSVPDWLVASAALIGIGVAWRQLAGLSRQLAALETSEKLANVSAEAAAESAYNQVQIARATLLLEIDRQFEGEYLMESRLAIRALRNRAVKDAREKSRAGIGDAELASVADQVFSEYVTRLWQDFSSADANDSTLSETKPEDRLTDRAGYQYSLLTRLLGWFETVGRLVEENLISPDDVFELYDAVFIQVANYFERHIHDRRDEGPNRNDRWMEKALLLRDLAKERQLSLKAQAKAKTDPGRVDWKG